MKRDNKEEGKEELGQVMEREEEDEIKDKAERKNQNGGGNSLQRR